MSRPGFRRSSSGGHGIAAAPSPERGPVPGAPFTQSQILLLMKSEFGRARRHGYPLACVLIRIDRAREYVETFGTEIRDQLRSALASVVAERTRDHDHIGLIGDDRYVLLLPHASQEQAIAVAGRLAEAFATRPITLPGGTLEATLSMGVVGNADRDTLFFDTLLSQGEVALERAVRMGGNRVEVFARGGASAAVSSGAPVGESAPEAAAGREDQPAAEVPVDEASADEVPADGERRAAPPESTD